MSIMYYSQDELNAANFASKPDKSDDRVLPPWCFCGNCREMPTDVEKLCCKDPNCMTKSNAHLHLLMEHVISSAIQQQQNPGENPSVFEIQRSKREAAYKKYANYKYGRLGKNIRKPLPSCVVWSVRALYPSPNDKYIGFKY